MSKQFQPGDYVAVHENPAWRDKSDFIIRAYLDENEGQCEWEQLWVKRIGPRSFSLCCIPFFAYNIALGDEVETNADFVVQRVLNASGQLTFRAWFGNSTELKIRDEVLRRLESMDAEFEWSSPNLLAISVKGHGDAQKVADFLCANEKAGVLTYETGQT